MRPARWLAALVGLLAAGGTQAEIEIKLAEDGRTFFAAGAASSDTFTVRVVGGEDLPAMVGKVDHFKGGLRFTPQFPLTPGVSYRASVGGVGRTFSVAELDRTPVARVGAVYPSVGILPENCLKFYLHFSEPMAIGDAPGHIRLIGPGGKPVPLPFLELADELWDPEGKRLTMFFDPGRVKRGLKPHQEEGRALQAGATYELQIDAAWRDSKGRAMVQGFRKKFEVSPADYEQPDPARWRMTAPPADTRKPVVIDFGEALDHALLERVLTVYGTGGKTIPGTVEVGVGESVWKWKPDQPWKAGSYRVVVEAILEDLAGNSVGRLFEEIDGRRETWNVRGGRFIRIPFVVAAKGAAPAAQ